MITDFEKKTGIKPNIRAITVYVDDVDAAVSFYHETLGFKIVHFSDEIVHLDNGGPPIILEKESTRNQAEYPGSSQVVLAMQTLDVTETIKKLRGLGVVPIYEEPKAFPGGVFTAIRDPAGNVIEVLEFRSAK